MELRNLGFRDFRVFGFLRALGGVWGDFSGFRKLGLYGSSVLALHVPDKARRVP